MGFKLFIFSLAVLAVAVSASSVCKCGPPKEPPPPVQEDSARPASKTVEKYTLKMNKDGKDYEEKIEIDTKRETETFHVPKTSPDEEAGDIVYDFKQNLTMIRIPAANSCFLMQSTGDVPKPADLKRLLENKDGVAMTKRRTETKLKVLDGTLDDRSHLIDEMVDLCAKLPIKVVVLGELDMSTNPTVQPATNPPAKRTKRALWHYVCSLMVRIIRVRVCGVYYCYITYYRQYYTWCRWVYYGYHG